MSAIILPGIWIVMPGVAHAASHWVSPTGRATWSSCVSSIPLSGTSACSLSTANSNAAAGDVVNLRAGTYTTPLAPTKSGNGSNLPSTFITFQAYTGETPTIASTSATGAGSYPFTLDTRSYIRVNGLTVIYDGSVGYSVSMQAGTNHVEIENCTFESPDGYTLSIFIGTLATSAKGPWSTNNWIHNNHFITSGQAHGGNGTTDVGCTDGGGDTLNIGHAYSPKYPYEGNTNNTVENNFFEHAPHANWDIYGEYTVLRNNVVHNEPWSLASAQCQANATYPATYTTRNPNYASYNNRYGHRNFQITEDYGRQATYMLVEGNRSGFAGVNQANPGADDFSLAAPQNIVRYNFFYGGMNVGIRLKYSFSCSNLGGGGCGGSYNRVYNNTFYQNGYGYSYASGYPSPCGNSSCPWGQASIGTENNNGNVVKNNIFYLSKSYSLRGWDVDAEGSPSNGWSKIVAANNWCSGTQTGGDLDLNRHHGCSNSGNPLFKNPDLTQPSSQTLPDLTETASSPTIDGGTYLTTATNAGSNSTRLTVADALYFQDGTWGSSLAKASAGLGGTFQADWIAIGTVTNVVQIRAVSYGTYNAPAGTITLASPMTWRSGAHIWLYRKSDGTRVLYGTAPDYGASEFVRSPMPTAPNGRTL